MADRGGRRRLRLAAAWLLTAVIAVFALVDWGGDDDARIAATAGDGDGDPELRIRMLSDAEVSPGDAIVVRFDNADPALPLAARIGGETADILDRRPRSAVVRVPLDAPTGRAPLRLTQGSRKSKAWDLLVRPPRHRKLWPRIIGGLALFLYGFGVLASGLRGLAGRRLRAQLGRLTEAPLRATGLGVAIGAATQLTTTATAVTVGLIEARLLALAPALAIAVGALLGASLIGALLPLGFAKVSLEIIAVGVVWTTLADRRHARAVGHAVLGAGLVLYGLRLLQTGVEPLLADPKLLPYVGYLQAGGLGPLALAFLVGVIGGLILQGPGPVYGLGLGLAQVSGALSLSNLLAILAGANLGAAIGAALILGSSARARPLARWQLGFGIAAALVGLALVPAVVALADALVPGAPDAIDYRKSVMVPHLSGHLALGFAASQLAIAAGLAALVAGPLARRLRARPSDPGRATATAELALPELAAGLRKHRAALDAIVATVATGERNRGELEATLAEARAGAEELFASLADAPSSPDLDRARRATLGTLQLQRAVEHLVHVAELGVERGLALSPAEHELVGRLHRLADASLAALIEATDGGRAIDLEAARGREIEMNLVEAAARTAGTSVAPRHNQSTSVRLGLAELIDGFEHLGNHLFRVAKALTEDDDDDLD